MPSQHANTSEIWKVQKAFIKNTLVNEGLRQQKDMIPFLRNRLHLREEKIYEIFIFNAFERRSSSNSSVVAQSCLTLWDPMDSSPPGSSVLGILQAKVSERSFPSPEDFSRPRDRTQVSCIAGIFFTVWATGKLYIVRRDFDRSRGRGTGRLEVESQGRLYKREKLVLSLQGWTQLQKEKMILAAEADSSQAMTCFRSVGK